MKVAPGTAAAEIIDDKLVVRKEADGSLTGEAIQSSDSRFSLGKVCLNTYLISLFWMWYDLCGKWALLPLTYAAGLLVPFPIDGWSYKTRMQVRAAVILHLTVSSVPAVPLWCLFRGGRKAKAALIGYVLWYLFFDDGAEGGHRFSPALRKRSFWRHFASYFPMRLTRTTELDPAGRYIFGYHPHGVISLGALTNFATDATGFSHLFPGIDVRLMTLAVNFRIPLLREYLMRLGIQSASRRSCELNLSRGGGSAIMLVIGGARESLEAGPGQASLVLASRKGFVKIAIRCGASLVPVFSFGENDVFGVYEATGWLRKKQVAFQKRMGFAMPLFFGRALTGGLLHKLFGLNVGVMPLRVPVHSVVGRPIAVQQCDSPSQEEIDRVHSLYMEELLRIHIEWRERCAEDLKAALTHGDARRLKVLCNEKFQLEHDAPTLEYL